MFTLAHLSDPHLAPLPHANWSELAGKRITGYLNWQLKRRFIHDPAVLARLIAHLKATATDHIAITGDFVNIALPGEFVRLAPWLAALGPPHDLTVIPGNHDAYVPGWLEMMRRACAASMCGDDGSEAFPFIRRRGKVALVALNTGVPSPPLMATGRLGALQLERLAQALAALKDAGLFRVVLIHHPPASEASWHKRLTDARRFRRVIADAGAELILHGHDHVQALHWLVGPDGRVPAVGVPSASATPASGKDSAAYNLYRIDGAPREWRCEMEIRAIGGDGAIATLRRTMLLA